MLHYRFHKRSEVYTVAIIASFMITKKDPYEEIKENLEKYNTIKNGILPKFLEIVKKKYPELDDILTSMTKLNPKERPHMENVNKDLLNIYTQ